MSNRVRETEQRQQEQVRKDRQNADANRAKQKAGQQTFQAQLRSQNQKPATQKKADQPQAQPQSTPTPGKQELPKSSLHARHGIQTKHFQSVLEERGGENLKTTRKTHDERGVESEEAGRTEQALLRELDRLEQEHPRIESAFDDGSPQSGHHSGKQGDSGESGNQRGQEDGLQGISGPKGAAGSGGEAALKANAIRALVDQLFVGFQGAKSPTVMLELKGDLFRGTRVQLTMEDGKLSLKFESPDPNLRRLLSSSRGELERALESKGLRLSRLEVNERE